MPHTGTSDGGGRLTDGTCSRAVCHPPDGPTVVAVVDVTPEIWWAMKGEAPLFPVTLM